MSSLNAFDWRLFAGIVASALVLRVVFGLLIRQTYDYDEFVILQLARVYARGGVPYHDFTFFHPPGVLVLFRLLTPLTDAYWEAGRWLVAGIDSLTAGLVATIGWRLSGRRVGAIAGILYAANPLTLVAGDRIGQDSLITFLGVLGLLLLLFSPSRRAAVGAGACLAIAVWIKYPAALFVPPYLLLARRRSAWMVVGAGLAGLLVFLPFRDEWHALYRDTVTFQSTRWLMKPQQRIASVFLFWIAANAPALFALPRRQPAWLVIGYATGAVFALSPQVYYHYFVPIVPFAALLGGTFLTRNSVPVRRLLPVALAVTLGWALMLDFGGPAPLYVTAASLPSIDPTLRIVERATAPGQAILADRLEYAYLTDRPEVANYFWNIGTLARASYLKGLTREARLVIQSRGASSGYPHGFDSFLNRRFPSVQTPSSTVWLIGKAK